MTKRLDILNESLKKKNTEFDKRFISLKDEVVGNQFEPLNDGKRGSAILKRWEKQNDTLRNIKKGIEKTERAIQREEDKIAGCDYVRSGLPQPILDLLEDGTLIQWRKYPHIFFVKGVQKARIYWDKKEGIISHKYVRAIKDEGEHKLFASVFNSLVRDIKQTSI